MKIETEVNSAVKIPFMRCFLQLGAFKKNMVSAIGKTRVINNEIKRAIGAQVVSKNKKKQA